MVNAQEALNQKYPNKNQVERINLKYLNSNQLSGLRSENLTNTSQLIIADYPNLKEITKDWENIPNLTQLTIINCPQLEEIDIWDSKNLQQLILNNLPNLKILDCFQNNLTNLAINNCDNLERINCWKNNLTQIKLPQGEKLEWLNLSNNNFNQDLSFLSDLVNLKYLYLDNNPLVGSLEYLKDINKLETLVIDDTDIDSGLEYLMDSLWEFGCSANHRKEAKCQTIANLFANDQGEVETDKYGKITNFSQKLQWIKLGFIKEERNSWINAGAKVDDYKFVAWLRDIKNYEPEWITNYKEDYQTLSERFQKYGLCPKCNQPNTGEQWCQPCNVPRLQENFTKWTSNNPQIDEFIQKYQLATTDADKFLEWVPYEQFAEIEYLAEGGFGKVYKAKWTEGNIHHWDSKNKQWHRKKDNNRNYREVVLKSLTNSQNNTDFLQETANHKIIDDWFNNIVPCYGISQDPQTGNYLMVMQYLPEGNLRHYLSKNVWKLTLKDKLSQLFHIAQGLKDLHQKNLVHRDFHSGNILKGIEKTSCLITDLGLCKPANEISKEDKIFGVMPYVAPEVLQSRPYTQASDVYSFGIVAYEILSGLPPYYDRAHNLGLAIEICQGMRPKFNIKIPPLLEDLIKRCWDTNPAKRPTANELEKILRGWEQDSEKDRWEKFEHGDREFTKQLQEAEEHNKALPNNIKFPDYKKKMHTGAVYHSKLLPTKEITRLLQSSQGTYGSSTISMSGLLDDFSNTSLEDKQPEQQAQILQNQPHNTPSSSKN